MALFSVSSVCTTGLHSLPYTLPCLSRMGVTLPSGKSPQCRRSAQGHSLAGFPSPVFKSRTPGWLFSPTLLSPKQPAMGKAPDSQTRRCQTPRAGL